MTVFHFASALSAFPFNTNMEVLVSYVRSNYIRITLVYRIFMPCYHS